MPRAVTLRTSRLGTRFGVAAWLARAALGFSAIGCEEHPEPGPSAAGSVIALPSTAPSASAHRVYATSWSLELPRRAAGPRSLVISGKRVLRVAKDEVEEFGIAPLQRVASQPLPGARYGLTLKDGAFVGLGTRELLLLPNPDTKREDDVELRTPRVSVFPGSQLFADRREERDIWVHHPFDASLYRYEVAPSTSVLLPMKEVVELKDFDHGAFAGLANGSFVYSVGKQLYQIYPGGKAKQLGELSDLSAKVWRILPTRRIDQVWVMDETGKAVRVNLADRLRVSSALSSPEHKPSDGAEVAKPLKPFDTISSGRYIARLLVGSGKSERRWKLVVDDLSGKRVLEVDLPPDPLDDGKAYDDWIQRVTRNFELAISDAPALVAVGGPNRITLWDLKTQESQKLTDAPLAAPSNSAR
ncbi:MAG: hypothetical protein KC766_13020 [Myxococcales bacterium]|nr:hypothetical protein [Myxococcales bacterium]